MKTLKQIGIVMVGVAGYHATKKAGTMVYDMLKPRVSIDSLENMHDCLRVFQPTQEGMRLEHELNRLIMLYSTKQIKDEKSKEKALNAFIGHIRSGIQEHLYAVGYILTKKAKEELDKDSKIRLVDGRANYENFTNSKKEKAS